MTTIEDIKHLNKMMIEDEIEYEESYLEEDEEEDVYVDPEVETELNRKLDKLIDRARRDFYTFVKMIAPEVLPEAFIDGRHIEIICDKLQDVFESVVDPEMTPKRIQIYLPPGSMKSKIASNLFPAWCLGKMPNWCFLAIGSDFEFAVDNFGRPTKDIVDLEQYKAIFPRTVLRRDVQGAGRWDTTRKGRYVARGAGQNIAGRRAHISICDDVITEQTTKLEREKINSWYQKGLRTRLLPRGAEIIINTRWYLDDLSGFLEKVDMNSKRPWEVIRIPAILDLEARELLRGGRELPQYRYEVGTSYWPEFWPTETLEEKRSTMKPHEWNALYQQSPIPEEGNVIKRHQFRYWNKPEPPQCLYIVLSLDTAFSIKETADYSAYSVWGVFNNYDVTSLEDSPEGETSTKKQSAILLASGKARLTFGELQQKAIELYNDFMVDLIIVENKASGQSLIQELQKASLPVYPYTPDKDKLSRLWAASIFFNSGRVFVPQNKQWAEVLIEDVCSFPKCPDGDDLVDTVSQALLWLRDTYNLTNDNYPVYESDLEDYVNRKNRKTYWNSL